MLVRRAATGRRGRRTWSRTCWRSTALIGSHIVAPLRASTRPATPPTFGNISDCSASSASRTVPAVVPCLDVRRRRNVKPKLAVVVVPCLEFPQPSAQLPPVIQAVRRTTAFVCSQIHMPFRISFCVLALDSRCHGKLSHPQTSPVGGAISCMGQSRHQRAQSLLIAHDRSAP